MAKLDIALGNRSESTGRFNFVRAANGDVSFDETQAHAVMTNCLERRNGYWANPNHGSLIWQLQSLTSRTPSQAQAMVLDALQFLEANGAITNVKVQATAAKNPIGGGLLGVTVSWTTPSGKSGTASI